MKSDYIIEQVKSLQNDYCCILKSIIDNFSSEDFPQIIDEINVFWFANRDLVHIFLHNISFEYNCYTFTGATFLDIEDFEHYPFIALGENHIIDDPLYKYTNIVSDISGKEFMKQIKEQMLLSIKDNISIIENFPDTIYILPVTLLSDLKTEFMKNASEQVFLSMFIDDSLTLDKYFSEFCTIDDVDKGLKEGISNTLIFTDEDDGDNLISRFNTNKSRPLPFKNDLNDAKLFFFLIIGFITQALSILAMCLDYRMIPYLRFEVAYRYFILLGGNFIDNKDVELILFKAICAHLLYKSFDKNKIKEISFSGYSAALKKLDFSNKLFRILDSKKIDYYKQSIEDIYKVLHDELAILYEKANEESSQKNGYN